MVYMKMNDIMYNRGVTKLMEFKYLYIVSKLVIVNLNTKLNVAMSNEKYFNKKYYL